MEKIKGYTEEEIRAFVAFMEKGKREGKNLSELFREYGAAHGRAKGSVRNFYYELLALAEKNAEVRDRYLNASELKAESIREFDPSEAREMMKAVLRAKQSGRSVRAAIRALAGGDEKLALRYQNKYRNMLFGDRELVSEIAAEVERETGRPCAPYARKETGRDELLERLKSEIDGLARRLSAGLRRENEALRDRVSRLESENLRLKMAGRGEGGTPVLFLEDVRKKHLN